MLALFITKMRVHEHIYSNFSNGCECVCVVCLFGLRVSELTRILFMLHDSICSAFSPQDAAAYLKAYTSIFFFTCAQCALRHARHFPLQLGAGTAVADVKIVNSLGR